MIRPAITVIISAYNRKQFLPEAIESVRRQSIAHDLYELIVVKNFHDEAVEKKVEEMGGKCLYFENMLLSPFISEAVENSKGGIICFLDDDDIFEQDKLEIVLKAFSENPDAGYYHNSLSFVDEAGTSIKPPYAFNFSIAKDPERMLLIPHREIPGKISKLIYMRHDFNRSCISVRKEILMQFMAESRKIEFSHDSFVFFCAAMSCYSLMIDSRRLTRYRVNRHSVTLSPTYNITLRQIRSYSVMRDMALKNGEIEIANLLERQILFFKTINAINNPLESRRNVMKSFLKFLEHRNEYNRMANAFAGVLSIIYLLSPTLSKRLYSELTEADS